MQIDTWTGSEHQRRPQGVCRPPTKPTNTTPRFRIPKAVLVEVQKVTAVEWQKHMMQKELRFERYETYEDRRYVFCHECYRFRVHRRFVDHREDGW